jgi:hypothetical protein
MKLAPFSDMDLGRFVVEKVFATERNAGVLDAAITILGMAKQPEDVAFICGKVLGKGDWQLRAALADALGTLHAPAAADAIRALLKSEKDPRVLSMALFGAGTKKLADAMDQILPHLEHSDWQVRVAAIEALGELKDERGLMPLIDRLMNERGRLREDIAQALRKITGKDFGRDANKWRQWYHERDKMEPDPPQVPAKPAEPGGSAVKDEPTYFGLPVTSDRVVFLVDVSLSMKTPIDIDKMKMAREAALTGKGEDGVDRDTERFEETIEWWKIQDRFDLAKAQLKFVIKNLAEAQQFEIVAFSTTLQSWNGGNLTKATARAKARAIRYIDDLKVEEATGIGAALDFAFEMAGPGAADKNYRTGVDTILVLSDGEPTDRPKEQILDDIRGRNRLRKIKIHTIAILNYSVQFLRLLAEQNGGIYRLIKVEDKH